MRCGRQKAELASALRTRTKQLREVRAAVGHLAILVQRLEETWTREDSSLTGCPSAFDLESKHLSKSHLPHLLASGELEQLQVAFDLDPKHPMKSRSPDSPQRPEALNLGPAHTIKSHPPHLPASGEFKQPQVAFDLDPKHPIESHSPDSPQRQESLDLVPKQATKSHPPHLPASGELEQSQTAFELVDPKHSINSQSPDSPQRQENLALEPKHATKIAHAPHLSASGEFPQPRQALDAPFPSSQSTCDDATDDSSVTVLSPDGANGEEPTVYDCAISSDRTGARVWHGERTVGVPPGKAQRERNPGQATPGRGGHPHEGPRPRASACGGRQGGVNGGAGKCADASFAASATKSLTFGSPLARDGERATAAKRLATTQFESAANRIAASVRSPQIAADNQTAIPHREQAPACPPLKVRRLCRNEAGSGTPEATSDSQLDTLQVMQSLSVAPQAVACAAQSASVVGLVERGRGLEEESLPVSQMAREAQEKAAAVFKATRAQPAAAPAVKYRYTSRVKAEREAFTAISCPTCQEFFSALDVADDVRRHHMQSCGRHRTLCPPSSTPPGFWDLDSFKD
ncbi:hypothetical protein DIPPA_26898 [Diplonema papillatum]|nr:hypothetical protein DIPPA_26898 [Diplonema papillatum]|eukprot:gene18107-27890_t